MAQMEPTPPRMPRVSRRVRLEGEALEALRLALAARNWTAKDLGLHAGVAISVATKLVNGETVSPATIEKIARAIDETRPNKITLRLLQGEIE